MLSLLLTSVLLMGALVAALRLRSAAWVVAVFAIAAAGSVLLRRRTLDALATQRIHLVYEVAAEHAAEPGPDLLGRTRAAVRGRLDALGLSGAEVAVAGNSIDIVVPADDEVCMHLRRLLGIVGHLEFVEVDDDGDPFRPLADDPETATRGVRILLENVPLGPGKTAARAYAFQPRGDTETILAARRRFQTWISAQAVPADRRIAVEKQIEYDPETNTVEETGWRTFVLARAPLLTGRHVREAVARPDTNPGSMGGWQVAIELTSEGASLFEEATARLVRRRFAIVLDGVVSSAPVIQTRISGGRAVITMGAGNPEEQAGNARDLEVVLRASALPAPLIPTKEDRLDAPLGRGALSALTAAAALLLLVEVAAAAWLVFRRTPAGHVPPT